MAKRVVLEIDLTFDNNYSDLTATDIMKLLIQKGSTVKRIKIKDIKPKAGMK